MASDKTDTRESDAAKQFYSAYQYHSNLLRTWLVAYGIGGPVLFLTNDNLWKALVNSGAARSIGGMFLIGVGLQVFLASLNKVIMWVLYYGEDSISFQTKRRYKIADLISEAFYIDFVIDLASLVLLGGATWKLFGLLAAAS